MCIRFELFTITHLSTITWRDTSAEVDGVVLTVGAPLGVHVVKIYGCTSGRVHV